MQRSHNFDNFDQISFSGPANTEMATVISNSPRVGIFDISVSASCQIETSQEDEANKNTGDLFFRVDFSQKTVDWIRFKSSLERALLEENLA